MIQIQVTHQSLKITHDPLAADSINYLHGQAVFSEDWDGAEKFLHFSNGEDTYVLLMTDNEFTIPSLPGGIWSFWIHGNIFDDGDVIQRITTNIVKLRVEATGADAGDPVPELTPSIGEQYLARMNDVLSEYQGFEDTITQLRDQAQESASAAATAAASTENISTEVNDALTTITALRNSCEIIRNDAVNAQIDIQDTVQQAGESIDHTAEQIQSQYQAMLAIEQSIMQKASAMDESYASYHQQYLRDKEEITGMMTDIETASRTIEALLSSGIASIQAAASAGNDSLSNTYTGMLSAIGEQGQNKLTALTSEYNRIQAELNTLIERMNTVKGEMQAFVYTADADAAEVRQIRDSLNERTYNWGDFVGGEG